MRSRLLALEADEHAALSPEAFGERYRQALVAVQNDLGTHGFAPVASTDTAQADRNRQPFVATRWPLKAGG